MQGNDDDLKLLVDAARFSGEIALGYFKRDPEVWDKDDNAGPVTEADIAVNLMLEDTLRNARPDFGWLSEESDDSNTRLGRDAVFIIDPIDGTRAFIDGAKDWGHSLAIVRNGVVTAGAVYMPVRDLMYAASLGGGATLNGVPIRVSDTATLAEATVLSNKANMKPHHWQNGEVPPVKRTFRSSLAYRMCLAAQGRFDAMMTLRPTWEWDVAAGTLIVTEAGGTVQTRAGQAPVFNSSSPLLDGLLAGGPVRALLQDVIAKPVPDIA